MQVIAYVYVYKHLFKSSFNLLERKIQAVLIIGVQACHKNCLKMLKTSLIYSSFDKLNAHVPCRLNCKHFYGSYKALF